MVTRKVFSIFVDRKGVNNVISAVILTSVVVALSLSMFGWAQSRSSNYNEEFYETVDAETNKLKERLAFEHVYYGDSSQNLSAYLLNCGTVDDVQIKTVYVYDENGVPCCDPFSDPSLYPLTGWTKISDLDLDVGEEGRLVLMLPEPLASGYYNVKVVTVRGTTFNHDFVVKD